MKTTIDLPSELVREMKLRAIHEGRKLKDVAAHLLKRGLRDNWESDSSGEDLGEGLAASDYLLSAPVGAPEMTPERVRQLLEEIP